MDQSVRDAIITKAIEIAHERMALVAWTARMARVYIEGVYESPEHYSYLLN